MNQRLFRRKNGGFSFVELAVAFAVLGAAALLLSQIVLKQSVAAQRLTSRSQLERAKDALFAFARLNGRFPCVATSREGLEDCQSTQGTGLVPFLTIGLPESSPIEYEVSEAGPSLTAEESSFVVSTANEVLSKKGGPTLGSESLSSLLGGRARPRLLDLCTLLAKDESFKGAAFDLNIKSASSQSNEVKVQHLSVSRMEVAGKLNCAKMAAAARAYFNVLLASAIMQRGASDGLSQLEESNRLSGWFSDQADYAEAIGALALARSLIAIPGSIGSGLVEKITLRKAGVNIFFSSVGAAISVVALGRVSSNLVRFHEMEERADRILAETKANKDDLALIDASIRERALRSASRTYFLEPSL